MIAVVIGPEFPELKLMSAQHTSDLRDPKGCTGRNLLIRAVATCAAAVTAGVTVNQTPLAF